MPSNSCSQKSARSDCSCAAGTRASPGAPPQVLGEPQEVLEEPPQVPGEPQQVLEEPTKTREEPPPVQSPGEDEGDVDDSDQDPYTAKFGMVGADRQ